MKKFYSLILVQFVLLISVPSCDYFFPPLSGDRITSKEAFEYLKKHSTDKDLVLLDIRKKEEYDRSHIQNAINLDYDQTDFPDKIEKLDKNIRYIIYDDSGKKSLNTLELMLELRFQKIHAIVGGFEQWRKESLPVNF